MKTSKTCFYIPNDNLPELLVFSLYGFQGFVFDLYTNIYYNDRDCSIINSFKLFTI